MFPVATVLAAVVNLLCALVPLFLIMVVTGHPLSPSLVVLPVAIVMAACFALGAGLLLSPLAAFFTDTVELVTILLTILMYLTPVFYPLSIVPEDLRWVVEANPIHWVLDVFRLPIYAGDAAELPAPRRWRPVVAPCWSSSSGPLVPRDQPSHRAVSMTTRPTDVVALESVGLRYRLAKHRIPSFKEYAVHWMRGALVYEELWALTDVSVRIGRGESIGIIGRNGAGKSTLLKVISRVLEPTRGRLTLHGSGRAPAASWARASTSS